MPLQTSLIRTLGQSRPVCRRHSKPHRKPAIRPRRFTTVTQATSNLTIPEVLKTLADSKDLTRAEAKHAVTRILEDPDPAQIAALLVLLRQKGESPEEIVGFVEGLRERTVIVHVPYDVLDIVGTGGDGVGSVNISTGASVIAAAAGAKVAKHGNRSVSSQCGSADVLEALGIDIQLTPEGVAHCVDQAGIGFMYAPLHSPHMEHVKKVRRSLGLPTLFNIMGPMLNPAKAEYGLVGVHSPGLIKIMADALMNLGVKKALVVHSMGIDELTPLGPADVLEVTQSGSKRFTIDPRDYGIPRCEIEDIKGGDKYMNARMLLEVFEGKRGAVADALNLNAGFALATCGIAQTPKDGIALAQEIQLSGKPMQKLEAWRIACKETKAIA